MFKKLLKTYEVVLSALCSSLNKSAKSYTPKWTKVQLTGSNSLLGCIKLLSSKILNYTFTRPVCIFIPTKVTVSDRKCGRFYRFYFVFIRLVTFKVLSQISLNSFCRRKSLSDRKRNNQRNTRDRNFFFTMLILSENYKFLPFRIELQRGTRLKILIKFQNVLGRGTFENLFFLFLNFF